MLSVKQGSCENQFYSHWFDPTRNYSKTTRKTRVYSSRDRRSIPLGHLSCCSSSSLLEATMGQQESRLIWNRKLWRIWYAWLLSQTKNYMIGSTSSTRWGWRHRVFLKLTAHKGDGIASPWPAYSGDSASAWPAYSGDGPASPWPAYFGDGTASPWSADSGDGSASP